MKRAFDETCFSSSDEEVDRALAHAVDVCEPALDEYIWSDEDEEDALSQVVNQMGGAVPTPLFNFTFTPVGQRRRWRNVVVGAAFRATLNQLRDATPGENLGTAITEALHVSINEVLEQEHAQPYDRVNFSLTAHGLYHAFQSVNMTVAEFQANTLRVATMLEHLAEQLNSNEDLDPANGFDVTLSLIRMPRPGRGRKKTQPGAKELRGRQHV